MKIHKLAEDATTNLALHTKGQINSDKNEKTKELKEYQKLIENDFVAITNVGAYGSSLSSNYNTRPLIAEILINKNKFKYIFNHDQPIKLLQNI